MMITAHSPAFQPNPPPNVKIPLFEHQRRLLQAMISLEQDSSLHISPSLRFNSNVGFLCDLPGAGKSLVVLALAGIDTHTRNSSVVGTVVTSFTSGSTIQNEHSQRLNSTVIVVPDFLMTQWSEYITNFTTFDVTQCVVLENRASVDTTSLTNARVILCTSEVYQVLAGRFHIYRLVFDEVDTIKIPACRAATADMIWCLSSNIERIRSANVMNRGFLKKMLAELRDLSAAHGTFIWDKLQLFTEPNYLQQSINVPSYYFHNVTCLPVLITADMARDPTKVSLLLSLGMHQHVSDALHMTCVASTGDMINELSCHKMDELRSVEARYFAAIAANSDLSSGLEDYQREAVTVMRDIAATKQRIINATVCPISQDTISYHIATRCCKNIFDATTLLPWVATKNTCPLCRLVILPNDLILCSPPNNSVHSGFVTKGDALKNIVHGNQNHGGRVLIYAGNSTIDEARQHLHRASIAFSEFRGRVKNKVLHSYHLGSPPVLLIHSDFSTGLNLTNTTHLVVFDDDVDGEILEQMVGRAQRIGRTQPLFVYKLKNIA